MGRSAVVLPGTGSFHGALSVPYAEIVIERHQPPYVTLCMVEARRALADAVKRGLIDTDTAGRLEAQMVECGMLPDMKAVCEQARKVARPDGCPPMLRFERCTDHEIDTALPRGRVMTSTGREIIDGSVTTLTNGFMACQAIAEMGATQLFDVATVLLEMLAADLPADDTERKARWDALDPATRRRIEMAERRIALQKLHAHPFTEMFGLGEIFAELDGHDEPPASGPTATAVPADDHE